MNRSRILLVLAALACANGLTGQIPQSGGIPVVPSGEDAEIVLVIVDPDGNEIRGWFSRRGHQVGYDDYFMFADHFGAEEGDPGYDEMFDIAPSSPNGIIDMDDFYRFADDFGKTVANADEVREFLGLHPDW